MLKLYKKEYTGVGKSNFTKLTFEYTKTVYSRIVFYLLVIALLIIIINLLLLTSVLEAISTPITGSNILITFPVKSGNPLSFPMYTNTYK